MLGQGRDSNFSAGLVTHSRNGLHSSPSISEFYVTDSQLNLGKYNSTYLGLLVDRSY
jgi:hypothetical protein